MSFFTLSIIASSSICHAHADTIEIKVIKFITFNNRECLIVFEALGGKAVEEKQRRYSVHIGYNPKHLALPVKEQEHSAALKFLQTLLLNNTKIVIWRMSGQGYRPIKNKKGHYRTDALKIVSYRKEEQDILFVHSDDHYFSTY